MALTPAFAVAEEPLRIGRNAGAAAKLAEGSALVVKAAYDGLGIPVRFEEYPLLRSLALADAGTIDGDVMRIGEAATLYPNLIRVDVPINFLEITVYMRAPCVVVDSWKDLRGHRVAYERGLLAIERRLQGLDAVPADNKPELFRMLSRGMVDMVIGSGLETDVIFRHLNDADLCRVSGMLERVPLYHFLNKRHAALAVRLQTQLQGMQKRGEIDAILRRERARLMGP